MNFVQWLSSLDELLYELMSWIIFFPLTLWRIVRHPLKTMHYAEEQLLLDPERQYRGSVSPPIMLMLTIVIVQGLSLALDGPNSIVSSRHGLAGLVNDNTTLLLLRVILFGTFAIILATRKVQRSDLDVDRDTLKPAFYAQCYAISPFVLLLSGGTTAATMHNSVVQVSGIATVMLAFLFYGFVEVRWFCQELGQSIARSFVDASIGMIGSIAVTISFGLLFR
jgi:hypothetical protein